MRTCIFILFSASLSLISCAQNISQVSVPAVIVNSFQQQNPKAADVEWKRKGSFYEVEFETGLVGKNHTMLLDSLGRVIYHKADIAESDLPVAVKKAILTGFAGYATDDIEKIENNGTVTYKVELKKKPEEWEVIFGSDGAMLSKVPD